MYPSSVKEVSILNQDLTTALYEAMAKEQANFRDWLVKQPPEEILNHTYEYTVREDILMAMEEPQELWLYGIYLRARVFLLLFLIEELVLRGQSMIQLLVMLN